MEMQQHKFKFLDETPRRMYLHKQDQASDLSRRESTTEK